MFYRYVAGVRKPLDLFDIQRGPCWIVGGALSLNNDLALLKTSRVPTIVMNNTANLVWPTYWVCADYPACFAESILKDPRIMKFIRYPHRTGEIDGERWCTYPNTVFYGAVAKSKATAYDRGVNLLWTKDVLGIAFQVAIRLGFTELRFVGCDLKISSDEQYAYASSLTEEEIEYNQRTYDRAVAQIGYFARSREAEKLSLCVCSPSSALTAHMPVKTVAEFVEKEPKFSDEPEWAHVKRKPKGSDDEDAEDAPH